MNSKYPGVQCTAFGAVIVDLRDISDFTDDEARQMAVQYCEAWRLENKANARLRAENERLRRGVDEASKLIDTLTVTRDLNTLYDYFVDLGHKLYALMGEGADDAG